VPGQGCLPPQPQGPLPPTHKQRARGAEPQTGRQAGRHLLQSRSQKAPPGVLAWARHPWALHAAEHPQNPAAARRAACALPCRPRPPPPPRLCRRRVSASAGAARQVVLLRARRGGARGAPPGADTRVGKGRAAASARQGRTQCAAAAARTAARPARKNQSPPTPRSRPPPQGGCARVVLPAPAGGQAGGVGADGMCWTAHVPPNAGSVRESLLLSAPEPSPCPPRQQRGQGWRAAGCLALPSCCRRRPLATHPPTAAPRPLAAAGPPARPLVTGSHGPAP
jgi:hypothetical protein